MDENLDILLKDRKENFDNIEVDFLRTFNSPSGKKVLKYLISITLGRYLMPNSTNEELHYLEGERFLVSFILNMIKKAKE
ncbi:hypothetical protein HDR59_02600 [bacterium]|nr:hypothetical protein [bacterium]